nr:hypothetical protein [uncultured Allomuricauda sp.]
MFKTSITIIFFFVCTLGFSQEIIPLDTLHWDIDARAHVLEPHMGKDAIYLQAGSITLKDANFLNGTIEYDIHLKKTRAFPAVYFRVNDSEAEQFYFRPHQSGNPDATQAIGVFKGLTAWQLYFGPKYSFPHVYNHDGWTHVKIVVEGKRAQIYLDNEEKPRLSWQLFHEPKAGKISFTGGGASGIHIANIKINNDVHDIKDFVPGKREPIDGAIAQWEVSDKFEEKLLDDTSKLESVVADRKWGKKIYLEEGVAANISRAVELGDDSSGNTVLAKITITSNNDMMRLFEFGYSDRVVAILNGKPIYKGNNRFRSRDYRYLGTIGLFDAVYLDLKKGKNTLLLAVSEDFGGWLVTGRFPNSEGLKIK